MSVFARLKKAREEKKGFTLVELIVVLVILAILAAILVPALLGWIDEAKEKQYVLDARNVYMATQVVVDEEYAGLKDTDNTALKDLTDSFKNTDSDTTKYQRIVDLSEVKFDTIKITEWLARTEGTAGVTNAKAGISKMTITNLRGDGVTAKLEDGKWTISKS